MIVEVQLTPEQLRLASCIERGMTDDEIAAEYGCSRNRVRREVEILAARVGVERRRHIVPKLRGLIS